MEIVPEDRPTNLPTDDLTVKVRIFPDLNPGNAITLRARDIIDATIAGKGVPVIVAQTGDSYGGAALILSDPRQIVALLIQRIEKHSGKVTVTLGDGTQLEHEGNQADVDALAKVAMCVFTKGLNGKLNEAIDELIEESLVISKTKTTAISAKVLRELGCEEVEPSNHQGGWAIDSINTAIKDTVSQAAGDRKARLLDLFAECGLHKRIGSASYLFKQCYETLHVRWEDATEIFEKNRGRSSWREYVRTDHPYLPEDLVKRLSGKLGDLTESEQEMISDSGADIARPSHIALEHAARLCGARPYQFTIRHLYDQLLKGRSNQEAKHSSLRHSIIER